MLSLKDLNTEDIKDGKFETEFPEFYALKNIIENNGGHINDQVFGHCIRTAEKLFDLLLSAPTKTKKILTKKVGNYSRDKLLFFSAFLHDIGKQKIKADQNGAFIGHEEAGAELIKTSTLEKTDISKEGQEHIINIVAHHGLLHEASNDTANASEHAQRIFTQHPSFALELVFLVLADLMASDLSTLNSDVYNFKTSFFTNILQNEQF